MPQFTLSSLEPVDEFWWSAMRQGGGTAQHPVLPPGGQDPLQALPLAPILFHTGLQRRPCPPGLQGQQCPQPSM